MRAMLAVAIALGPQMFCLLLLGASVYPDGVENVVIVLLLLLIIALNVFIANLVAGNPVTILLLVIGIVILIWQFSPLQRSPTQQHSASASRRATTLRQFWRWVWLLNGCVLGLTIILLSTNMLLKGTFSLVEPTFVNLIAQPPSPGAIAFIEQQVGPYYITEQAQSEAGGIYLKMRKPDFFVGDRTIYGFAYQPNASGSPFGGGLESDRHYQIHPIRGDWYWFQDNFGSDDWRHF